MSKAKDHVRIPAQSCPFCGYTFTAVGMLEDGQPPPPEPGDINVCMKCAAILFFDDALHLRKPRLGEVEAMFAENPEGAKEVREMQRRVTLIDWTKPPPKQAAK